VDRLTTGVDAAMQFIAFGAADALWESFQTKIDAFVQVNGGSSSLQVPEIARPDWDKVMDVLDGNAPLSTLSKDCPD